MNAQHTPGRLTVRGGYSIYADDGKTPVADTCLTNSVPDNDEANARRLVACWNACEMVSTEDLEALTRPGDVSWACTIDRVVRERDKLLGLLTELMDTELAELACEGSYAPVEDLLGRIHATIKANSSEVLAARAAIAKAGGEA